MAKQIVMDATGDTRHEFDPADNTALADAERRFNELTGVGFTAAVRRGEGRSELIRSFDPAAEESRRLFHRLSRGGLRRNRCGLRWGFSFCHRGSFLRFSNVPLSLLLHGT